LEKYHPESKTQKKSRLQALAANKEKGKEPNAGPKPITLKFGLNHVTYLVENNKAKLVVIAADVTPVELVVWLPQLCKKKGVTFCIVKSKAKLGALVGQKSATCVALKDVKKEDSASFEELGKSLRAEFNDNAQRRYYTNFKLGLKSQHRINALSKAREKDIVSKN
jgi:large subunit ribosomal protein L7Ae